MRMMEKWTGGGHRRRRLGFLRRVLVGLAVVVGVVGVPFGVSAVRNIFTGFGAITDIQFEGQDIDKVVYQGTVIWERVRPMQKMTAANCPTTRVRAMDARDNASYWVRKIGGLCWMETNLAYAGGGDNTYGDVVPAITQGFGPADSIYTEARYFVPVGSNRTTDPTNPSVSTDGKGQYGYLYNFCAAMNRQAGACQYTEINQPNQGVNGGTAATQYNVCPAGWRLPIGDAAGGEFASLNNAINGGQFASDAGLRTNGLWMYGGYFNFTAIVNQGTHAYYWSSTVYGAYDAYLLYFTGYSGVGLSGSTNYRNGFAVRCVAD